MGRFSLELREFHEERYPNYDALQAHVGVYSAVSNELVQVLAPELRFYTKNKETTTEVALRMGQREDLYLILAGVDETGSKASLKVFINPLQVWLWYGTIIMIVGGVIVAVPVRGATKSVVAANSAATEVV